MNPHPHPQHPAPLATEQEPVGGPILEREIFCQRVFHAPRELLWRVWSEPEHLTKWFGPHGFTTTFHEFDFRPGGHWRFIMHGPDGTDFKNHNLFIEIRKPELIVYDHVNAPHFRTRVILEDLGDNRTRMTFRLLFNTVEECDAVRVFAKPGAEQNFDRLATLLKSFA